MKTVLRIGALAAVLVVIAYSLATALAPSARRLPVPALQAPPSAGDSVAVFAGGCFWGIQAVFEHIRGVKSALSGYSGGTARSPGYEDVSSGTTGHAESVRVVFDPAQVSYAQLLQIFFSVAHDPTQLNRQGPDVGTQYRSVIFYMSEAQKQAAQAYVQQLTQARAFPRPIVTQIVPFRAFYPAEDYHQDYALHHPDSPYIMYNDAPKVANLRKQFPAMYREYDGRQTAAN